MTRKNHKFFSIAEADSNSVARLHYFSFHDDLPRSVVRYFVAFDSVAGLDLFDSSVLQMSIAFDLLPL
jgi:hypothetical protein